MGWTERHRYRNCFEAAKFELPLKGVKVQWVPDEEELERIKNLLREVIK